MSLTISLVFVILSEVGLSCQKEPVVQLPQGKILGREAQTFSSKVYYAFEKVPYAAAPIGNLRFQPPQLPRNWSGVLNTTYLDVSCYQLGRHIGIESEDCLYLNVYTPKLTSRRKNRGLLPVMVFIHGGGFVRGWNMLYPPDLFINEDVVYVSVNYRLGIFGFLSTEDDVVPGNNGLKDQLFALKWVHNNIGRFGGDSNNVLIFGQSSGAGSVAYHLLNPDSKGLFSKVIMQSGTFLTQGSIQRNPGNIALDVANSINSTFKRNTDSRTLVEFFKNMDSVELNAAVEKHGLSLIKSTDSIVSQTIIWGPVIEVENPESFLTEKMYVLLKSGQILAVPTLMGFTSEECILEIADANTLKETLTYVDQNLDQIVPIDMRLSGTQNRTTMGTKIRKIYTGGDLFANNLSSGVRYCSDNRITRPMIKHAELYSKLAPIYFYQFSYDGEIGGNDVHAEGAENVNHSEDVEYLFCGGANCSTGNFPQSDVVTRQRLVKLWTNFAKYGNPTPRQTELLQNIIWPKLSSDCENGDFVYLDIDKDLQVKNHPKGETYEEWKKLYDSLGYDDFDTY